MAHATMYKWFLVKKGKVVSGMANLPYLDEEGNTVTKLTKGLKLEKITSPEMCYRGYHASPKSALWAFSPNNLCFGWTRQLWKVRLTGLRGRASYPGSKRVGSGMVLLERLRIKDYQKREYGYYSGC